MGFHWVSVDLSSTGFLSGDHWVLHSSVLAYAYNIWHHLDHARIETLRPSTPQYLCTAWSMIDNLTSGYFICIDPASNLFSIIMLLRNVGNKFVLIFFLFPHYILLICNMVCTKNLNLRGACNFVEIKNIPSRMRSWQGHHVSQHYKLLAKFTVLAHILTVK